MRRILLVCGAVVAIGTVAACTNSTPSSSSAVGLSKQAASGPAAANRGSADGAALPANGSAGGKSASAVGSVQLIDGVRIRTADLTVAVRGAKNIAITADKADGIATYAGGEIDADDRTTGVGATATLRLRVPPSALQQVLRSLAGLGTEQSRQVSSKDVTEQVADVSSRVASAQQAIARLRGLYAHAVKVADVISIEGELSSRESDLESLQAQQRALSRQTTMASVTLYLRAKAAAKPHQKKQGGFLGGLSRGWHSFGTAAAALATGLGAALPFLLLLVLLAGALRFIWPRFARRPAPRPSPSPFPSE